MEMSDISSLSSFQKQVDIGVQLEIFRSILEVANENTTNVILWKYALKSLP